MPSELKIVTFNIGKEKFGLDIMNVDAVIEYEETTKLPNASDYFEGVINYRNEEVLPIINLRRKFKMSDFEDRSHAKVIVLKIDQRRVGIMVDDVKNVRSIDPNLINEKPNIGGMRGADFISGIARLEDGMLVILDIDKLLTEEEKIAIDEVINN
ncbi:chemotaxis protein W [Petrotoga sp. 9T1HF07.CasAA.8.2]|jgi:purine-binding chemotaxis protein CheW|uniref:chemotaxis protein CheW n=1 Tax=unclassified Petrotoga TaxID=2620614 RepID=UPI000CAF15DA|nr:MULTISPECIES: chemotaxis protein CheW [unclassified Petrotoga]MBL5980989.1 chemotaxis protein CheW [Petrotoga sp. 8T1HF07.NaAc.6.1]MDK2812194.1 purine-binding chemotaxis protein CheW [Petrotoga sp.]PNR87035.1 chemotaxis protein W [Petrotoga sp. 9T1HF07.CasAA.8.2]